MEAGQENLQAEEDRWLIRHTTDYRTLLIGTGVVAGIVILIGIVFIFWLLFRSISPGISTLDAFDGFRAIGALLVLLLALLGVIHHFFFYLRIDRQGIKFRELVSVREYPWDALVNADEGESFRGERILTFKFRDGQSMRVKTLAVEDTASPTPRPLKSRQNLNALISTIEYHVNKTRAHDNIAPLKAARLPY